MSDNDKLVERFLNEAFRNIELPALSDDDVADIAAALQSERSSMEGEIAGLKAIVTATPVSALVGCAVNGVKIKSWEQANEIMTAALNRSEKP